MEMLYFGLVDNGVLLICMAFGIEFDRFIPMPPRLRSKAAGAVLGAVIGNGLSDGLAALPQGVTAAFWVMVGCFIPLVAVPWVLHRIARNDAPVCTSDDPNNHQGDTCPIHEAEWAEVAA